MCCAVGCKNWQEYPGKQFSLPMDKKLNAKNGILLRKRRHKLLDHQKLKTAVAIFLLVYMHL